MAGQPAGAFLFRYSQTEPDKLSLTYSAAASGASLSASGSLRPKHCLVYNLGAAGFGLSANSAAPSTGTDKGSSNSCSSGDDSTNSGNATAFENIAAFVAAHSGSRLSVAVASELSLQFQAEVQQEAKTLKEEEEEEATAAGTDGSEVDNPVEGGSAETWSLYGSADLLMGRSTSESPHQERRKTHSKPLSLTGSASPSSSLLSSSWTLEPATAVRESLLTTKSGPWPGSDNASSGLKPLPLLPSPQEALVGDALSKPPSLGVLDRQVSASTANDMMIAELVNDEREIAGQQVVICEL